MGKKGEGEKKGGGEEIRNYINEKGRLYIIYYILQMSANDSRLVHRFYLICFGVVQVLGS